MSFCKWYLFWISNIWCMLNNFANLTSILFDINSRNLLMFKPIKWQKIKYSLNSLPLKFQSAYACYVHFCKRNEITQLVITTFEENLIWNTMKNDTNILKCTIGITEESYIIFVLFETTILLWHSSLTIICNYYLYKSMSLCHFHTPYPIPYTRQFYLHDLIWLKTKRHVKRLGKV